jgi:predicted DNA-binding transcriptional regulator AlpA
MQGESLPATGFVRVRDILKVVPVSKSTWWSGVRAGRYPQPTRALGARITAWRVEDIRALIEAAAPKADA